MSNLILHPKHGVAPCMTSCPYCGEDSDEIALLGIKCNKIMQELHGHDYTGNCNERVVGTSPCKRCKETLEGGGIIFLCHERGMALILNREACDKLAGRLVGREPGKIMDIDGMRGRVFRMKKGWWNVNQEGDITFRDPKEWDV